MASGQFASCFSTVQICGSSFGLGTSSGVDPLGSGLVVPESLLREFLCTIGSVCVVRVVRVETLTHGPAKA